jgi:2-dehydro-3-deoxygalactonokinase
MARLTIDNVPVRIAAGCADGTEDVMRGEETQIFGALTLRPALAHGSHLVVLPGTHCKWAWIEDGAIVRIRTVLTGELYALLRGSSLLTFHSNASAVHDAEGFAAGVAEARISPGVLTKLFTARAAQLRSGRSHDWATSYLSGLLVAGEVAEMSAAYGIQACVTIVGETDLTALYGSVFDEFEIPNDTLEGEACVLSGLRLLDEIN